MSEFLKLAIGAALGVLLFTLTACEELFGPPERPPKPRPVDPPPEPPKPPAEQTVVVQDDVTVVPPTTTVAGVTTDTVSFAALVQHAAGEVLVFDRSSATPNGLLRKVTAVSADRRTVTTEQATLEDVIESGTVEIGGSLKPSDLTPQSQTMLRDIDIVTGNLPTAAAGGYDFPWTFPSVITLSGSILMSLDYSFVSHYDGDRMSRAEYALTPRQRLNLKVKLGGNVTKALQAGTQFELFKQTPLLFGTIVFPAGPVPVIVQPSFSIRY